jgi:mRNA interferase YafQ
MNRLREAMTLLVANVGPLPAEWLDHSLAGEGDNHRECRIGSDLLLIYTLADIGKHGLVVSSERTRIPNFFLSRTR